MILEHPRELTLVARFSVPDSQTWGSNRDAAFKDKILAASGVDQNPPAGFEWFAFSIKVYGGRNLIRRLGNAPDIENFPKLIVDAFTGILVPRR